jgi:hypothetical protein
VASDRIDARALRFALGFPVVLGVAFGVAGFTLHGEVPHGVVLPVGGAPLPVFGYLGIAAGVIAVVGWAIGTQAARTVLPGLGRRLVLGLAVAVDLFLAALFASALVAQAETPLPPGARLDSIVLATGTGGAVALGVVMAAAFKPDEQWTSRDDQALTMALDPDLARDRLQYWIHPRSSVLVMIALCGAFPGTLVALALPWLGMVIFVLAMATIAFLCARVAADRAGVRVFMAGVLPVLDCPSISVLGAAATNVTARTHGGWGLRRHGPSSSYLAASGPAVVVRLANDGGSVIGAPDPDRAETLAELLNRRAGKPAG